MAIRSRPSGSSALAVPDHRRRAAGHLLERDGHVAVAVGAGEDDDRALHAVVQPLDPEILDHRVGEQLAAHVLDLRVAGAVGKVELDQLAGAHVVDAREAKAFERVVDRLALRIEHAVLRG